MEKKPHVHDDSGNKANVVDTAALLDLTLKLLWSKSSTYFSVSCWFLLHQSQVNRSHYCIYFRENFESKMPGATVGLGGMSTFNMQHGFVEALVRGFRSGFLQDESYHHLSQCDTLEVWHFYSLK